MDKEFLSDYSDREKEENERLQGYEIDSAKEHYRTRYHRLNTPVAHTAAGESVWPQIPLYGTLVIGLSPFSPEYFASYHGFDPSDVARLVDFAKDTGHVAFVLEDDAKEFAGLDFLDPIFTELKPREALSLVKSSAIANLPDFRNGLVEFDTLSRVTFYKFMSKIMAAPEMTRALGPNATPMSEITYLSRAFASLAILGYRELKESVSDAIVENPLEALSFLMLLDELVVQPRTDPFDAISNLSRGRLEQMCKRSRVFNEVDKMPEVVREGHDRTYAREIGKFLMAKLAPYPESFEACRVMCDTYKHWDLQQVMVSLQQAVRSKDYSGIQAQGKNLSEALENAWLDASKLGRNTNLIRAGLTLAAAVLGTVAAGPVNAVGGVLAGLGYPVLDKVLELRTDSISERIASWLVPNYIVNIFDFRKKYPLHERNK